VKLKNTGLKNYPEADVFFALLSAASELQIAFAAWSLPLSDEYWFLADFSETILHKKIKLEENTPGFVVQPFLVEEQKGSFFLKADFLYSTHTGIASGGSDTGEAEKKNQLLELAEKKLIDQKFHVTLPAGLEEVDYTTSKEHFIQSVEAARQAIGEGKFKKVVLARSKKIKQETPIEICDVWERLRKQYPKAFLSFVSMPKTGAWITATPEVLVSTNNEGIFRTVALAGTQRLKEGATIQNAVWTQKEIEEQALVGRYIINCFKKIRLREFEETGPKTIQSGNLLHLRTDFSVDMRQMNIPDLGTMMLELLHPTSAVCGMPKEEALAFIDQHEQLDRQLFSGFIGPVQIKSESHIFVNLRCVQVFGQSAVLYAGAGITEDSVAEKEFVETELKMEAVGKFLF
jgi:isochorismate synthase